MHYFTLEGEHYQMGVKRGTIFRQNKISFPIHLDAFQMEHGKQSHKILKKFFPEVCEEIKGVSDTVGVDYMKFVSWLLCMGCCMYNLPNNIPQSEIRGCTAFAFSKNGHVLYGRNNDLPPFLKNESKSEFYIPQNGNHFHMFTSSFINGEEAMNESLVVAMTFVMTNLQKIKPGFNSCFVVRYLIEKAKSTQQALRLIENLPIASNCNILIADKSGEMVVVECTPDYKKIRKAEKIKGGSMICTVNRFVSDEMSKYDDTNGEDYRSEERYQTVKNSFSKYFENKNEEKDLIQYTQKLLRGEYGFLCQYDDEKDFATIWSSIFDLKNLYVYHTEGDPREYEFKRDDRLHNIIKP